MIIPGAAGGSEDHPQFPWQPDGVSLGGIPNGKEVGRSELFIDFAILFHLTRVPTGADTKQLHVQILEQVEEVLKECSSVDVAATKLKCDSANALLFQHFGCACQDIQFVSFNIHLQQVDLLNLMLLTVVVNTVDWYGFLMRHRNLKVRKPTVC